jgi:hypothetical protein
MGLVHDSERVRYRVPDVIDHPRDLLGADDPVNSASDPAPRECAPEGDSRERALARDHAAENIRVNCVAPGIIRTPFHDAMSETVRENNLRNRIPLGREGTPEQVASLILQLITNGFITGETFTIDGGMSMRMV